MGLFFTLFVTVAGWAIWSHSNKIDMYRTMSYQWYRFNYPEAFKNNRVHCYSCGHNRIHVRALLQQTYFREHFCTQCGTTLYYSPEGH